MGIIQEKKINLQEKLIKVNMISNGNCGSGACGNNC